MKTAIFLSDEQLEILEHILECYIDEAYLTTPKEAEILRVIKLKGVEVR